MKLPLRLRAWHSNTVEDADGSNVCYAASIPDAKLIVTCVNAFNGIDLTVMPDGALRFEAWPQVSAAAELIDQLERKAIRFELALRKLRDKTAGGTLWHIANDALEAPDAEPRSEA